MGAMKSFVAALAILCLLGSSVQPAQATLQDLINGVLVALDPSQLNDELQQAKNEAQKRIDIAKGNLQQAFNDFKTRFNKQYNSIQDEAQAFFNFGQNAATVFRQTITQGTKDAFLDIGPLADLSLDDFKKQKLGFNASNLVPDLSNPDTQSRRLAQSLPARVNWVAQGKVAPVKDQGKCGSCWIFAGTSAIETASAIYSNELYSLSEEQTLDCGASQAPLGDGCNGGQIDWTLQYAIENGGLTASDAYAYDGKQTGTCQSAANWKVVQISRMSWVTPSKDEQAMMAAVAKGSVVVGVNANNFFWQNYGGGVVTDFSVCNGPIDHAVVIVGYDQTPDGQYYWIVRNSWSKFWGESGYIRLAMGTTPAYPAGMCGILTYGLRPVKNGPNVISGTAPSGVKLVNLAGSPALQPTGGAAGMTRTSLITLGMAVMGALTLALML